MITQPKKLEQFKTKQKKSTITLATFNSLYLKDVIVNSDPNIRIVWPVQQFDKLFLKAVLLKIIHIFDPILSPLNSSQIFSTSLLSKLHASPLKQKGNEQTMNQQAKAKPNEKNTRKKDKKYRNKKESVCAVQVFVGTGPGLIFPFPDGIHWKELLRARTVSPFPHLRAYAWF